MISCDYIPHVTFVGVKYFVRTMAQYLCCGYRSKEFVSISFSLVSFSASCQHMHFLFSF